jgi:hypothetical protein
MHWLLAGLLAVQPAPSANADWWFITTGGDPGAQRAYYSDVSSVQRRGDRVTVWEHAEYQTPNNWGSNAATIQYEYDCRARTARMAYSIFYAPDGRVTDSGPGLVEIRQVNAGTVAEAQFAFACGDRSQAQARVPAADLRRHAESQFR